MVRFGSAGCGGSAGSPVWARVAEVVNLCDPFVLDWLQAFFCGMVLIVRSNTTVARLSGSVLSPFPTFTAHTYIVLPSRTPPSPDAVIFQVAVIFQPGQ